MTKSFICSIFVYKTKMRSIRLRISSNNYSAPIEVSPMGMSNRLTVVLQQALHCISNFRSSWQFLRWSVTWQNHRHHCQFESNR